MEDRLNDFKVRLVDSYEDMRSFAEILSSIFGESEEAYYVKNIMNL